MVAPTYTKSGAKATSSVKLDDKIFAVEVASHQLLKDAYLGRLAGMRANLAKAKRRGEVSGGGRKPWRQKGTGRARAGSTRSPIWRGGGVTFGPTGNENFSRDLNARMRRKALAQSLSLKAKDGKVIVLESFEPAGNKTKAANNLLAKVSASGRSLLILGMDGQKSHLAVRNLAAVTIRRDSYVDAFDVLNADTVVITKTALAGLSERLGA